MTTPQEFNGGVPGGNYDAEQAPNGTWTIKALPIFSEVEAGKRGNQKHVGPEWMNAAIAKSKELKEVQQHMAPVHLGHHGALKNKDTPRVGFLSPQHIGRLLIEGKPSWCLFADVVGITQEHMKSLKNLSHPYRSVEIGDWNKPEIASLALLSDESPYFKFPMLTIGQMKSHAGKQPIQFGSERDGNYHFFEFDDSQGDGPQWTTRGGPFRTQPVQHSPDEEFSMEKNERNMRRHKEKQGRKKSGDKRGRRSTKDLLGMNDDPRWRELRHKHHEFGSSKGHGGQPGHYAKPDPMWGYDRAGNPRGHQYRRGGSARAWQDEAVERGDVRAISGKPRSGHSPPMGKYWTGDPLSTNERIDRGLPFPPSVEAYIPEGTVDADNWKEVVKPKGRNRHPKDPREGGKMESRGFQIIGGERGGHRGNKAARARERAKYGQWGATKHQIAIDKEKGRGFYGHEFQSQPSDHSIQYGQHLNYMKSLARASKTSNTMPAGRIDGQGFKEFALKPISGDIDKITHHQKTRGRWIDRQAPHPGDQRTVNWRREGKRKIHMAPHPGDTREFPDWPAEKRAKHFPPIDETRREENFESIPVWMRCFSDAPIWMGEMNLHPTNMANKESGPYLGRRRETRSWGGGYNEFGLTSMVGAILGGRRNPNTGQRDWGRHNLKYGLGTQRDTSHVKGKLSSDWEEKRPSGTGKDQWEKIKKERGIKPTFRRSVKLPGQTEKSSKYISHPWQGGLAGAIGGAVHHIGKKIAEGKSSPTSQMRKLRTSRTLRQKTKNRKRIARIQAIREKAGDEPLWQNSSEFHEFLAGHPGSRKPTIGGPPGARKPKLGGPPGAKGAVGRPSVRPKAVTAPSTRMSNPLHRRPQSSFPYKGAAGGQQKQVANRISAAGLKSGEWARNRSGGKSGGVFPTAGSQRRALFPIKKDPSNQTVWSSPKNQMPKREGKKLVSPAMKKKAKERAGEESKRVFGNTGPYGGGGHENEIAASKRDLSNAEKVRKTQPGRDAKVDEKLAGFKSGSGGESYTKTMDRYKNRSPTKKAADLATFRKKRQEKYDRSPEGKAQAERYRQGDIRKRDREGREASIAKKRQEESDSKLRAKRDKRPWYERRPKSTASSRGIYKRPMDPKRYEQDSAGVWRSIKQGTKGLRSKLPPSLASKANEKLRNLHEFGSFALQKGQAKRLMGTRRQMGILKLNKNGQLSNKLNMNEFARNSALRIRENRKIARPFVRFKDKTKAKWDIQPPGVGWY